MNRYLKFFHPVSVVSLVTILLCGCSSSTVIHTIPEGAKVYINGEFMGETPCYYEDTRISFITVNSVRLEKEGYKSYHSSFTRDEVAKAGPIIAGCILFALPVPWLWSFGYKNSHSYQMEKDNGKNDLLDDVTPEKSPARNDDVNNPPSTNKSKADQLRELKELQDEGILSEEEFETEKKKILNEE